MLVIESAEYLPCFTRGKKWEIFLWEKSILHINFDTHRCFLLLLHLVPIASIKTTSMEDFICDNGDVDDDGTEVDAIDPHPLALAPTD